MLTLCLHPDTPSWHCGVPTDPSRWCKVVTAEGGVAIEAEYTLPEFYLMAAIHEDVPLVVGIRALDKLVELMRWK
jgi:hypothetical protein